MKKFLSFYIFLFFCTTSTAISKNVRGKIITLTDTMDVTLKIPTKGLSKKPDYLSMQYQVEFWDEKGKKKKLKPPRVLEVHYYWEGKPVKLMAKNDANQGQMALLRVIVEGAINVYQYFYVNTNDVGMYTDEKLVVQREGDQVQYWSKYGFKKQLKKYVADCPDSYDLINKKRLENHDLVEIIQFYNAQCVQ